MADGVETTSRVIAGLEQTITKVATREIPGSPVEHCQLVNLAYSAPGSKTPAQVDAEGLLVSANPKIAVASNTGTKITVLATAGGSVVLAANVNRNGYAFYLEGDAFISWGGTPDNTCWKQFAFQPHNEFVGVIYTGEIKAISDTGGPISGYVREY